MIKAIIFDMDGVIIDSEFLWSEAIENMLTKRGFEYDMSAKVKFMGGGLGPELQHYKEKFDMQESVDEIKEDLVDIVLEVFEERLVPKEGSIELLNKLSDQNYRLALATSSPGRVMKYVVSKFGIEDKFEVMVTDDEVSKPKPSPEIYLLAAKKLNLVPENCLAIEDSLNGANSAKAAGMKVIGLENRIVKKDDFEGVDMVVSSLNELDLDSIE